MTARNPEGSLYCLPPNDERESEVGQAFGKEREQVWLIEPSWLYASATLIKRE
jgi:hypothetical protein